jgi:hypothetical protein
MHTAASRSADMLARARRPESTALQTSLQAVYDDFNTAATHWVTGTGQLDELTSALLNGVGANNPLASERRHRCTRGQVCVHGVRHVLCTCSARAAP